MADKTDADRRTTQLRLTPKESNRLRQVSYERQLERGMSRPGYAGLVPERFDAEPFQPVWRKEKPVQEVPGDMCAGPKDDILDVVRAWVQKPKETHQH